MKSKETRMKDLSQYFAGEKDARLYQLKIITITLAIYVCFALFTLGMVNVWWMIVLSSLLVTHWMITFHELLHLKKPEELDYITRLFLIPFSPFNLGYREYRDIHMRHHLYTATSKDPDAFHILGGSLKAFFGALTQHEQASFRYIRSNGVSLELGIMMFVRFSVFSGLLFISPQEFLLWWTVLRVTYTINDFVFFHFVHYRSGVAGTFSIPLPSFLLYPALLIYGKDVVYGTMYHDTHHEHSMIAARYLRVAAKEINESS